MTARAPARRKSADDDGADDDAEDGRGLIFHLPWSKQRSAIAQPSVNLSNQCRELDRINDHHHHHLGPITRAD